MNRGAVMVVSRWLWFAALCEGEAHSKSNCNGGVALGIVGLRRCARGKCIPRVANRMGRDLNRKVSC